MPKEELIKLVSKQQEKINIYKLMNLGLSVSDEAIKY